MEEVFGSKNEVYTGAFADDYKLQALRDLEILPKYAVTGVTISLLANRLSWFYNLTGPSYNIDTVCSSKKTQHGRIFGCVSLKKMAAGPRPARYYSCRVRV